MNKTHWVSLGIIIASIFIIGITTSFAYFVANVQKENQNNTSLTSGSIGNISYNGELTYTGVNIYPGEKGIQTFTIEKGSQSGTGIYEIDLEANVPETFGNDIEITLYKTTTPETNNIEKKEGTIVQTNEGFYKEDEITINGTPELVYGPEVLTTNSQIILEQADFNTETLEQTTYYLVYEYKNNGNQNAQQGQIFSGKVTVRLIPRKTIPETIYTEAILNGTDPVLENPLIPVTIESNGTVKRADLTSEWYSYANKEWANAVILFDESTNSNYQPGNVIPEEAIESYFVWIPKYRYQLWDLGQYTDLTSIDESKVHEISILFGNYNTSDEVDGECTTQMESGATGNCAIGDYMTHPAFLSIPSTGFWVGKFETGYQGASSITEAEQNIRDSSKVAIKPNIYSWRGIQVANAFYTSYDYKRDLESHMMKNTEWGAVAYLQHSAYGSQASVRINNNSSYITGYAANNEPTCGYTATNEECNRYCNDETCNTVYPNSVLASTTGNITGIYDMSGGAWEYVMGAMIDQNGSPMSGRNSLSNSGFNGLFGCSTCDGDLSGLTSLAGSYEWPNKKYYDTYSYNASSQQFQRKILGDATGEMGPFSSVNYSTQIRSMSSWHANYASFVWTNNSIFTRGGSYANGIESGLFTFGNLHGGAHVFHGFRVVLTL